MAVLSMKVLPMDFDKSVLQVSLNPRLFWIEENDTDTIGDVLHFPLCHIQDMFQVLLDDILRLCGHCFFSLVIRHGEHDPTAVAIGKFLEHGSDELCEDIERPIP